jgi:hypothetical protein
VPFTYGYARRLADGGWVGYERNLAKLRTAKPHTTIKYLDPDFAEMFVNALAGQRPNGIAEAGFRGRHVGRNAAMGALVLAERATPTRVHAPAALGGSPAAAAAHRRAGDPRRRPRRRQGW